MVLSGKGGAVFDLLGAYSAGHQQQPLNTRTSTAQAGQFDDASSEENDDFQIPNQQKHPWLQKKRPLSGHNPLAEEEKDRHLFGFSELSEAAFQKHDSPSTTFESKEEDPSSVYENKKQKLADRNELLAEQRERNYRLVLQARAQSCDSGDDIDDDDGYSTRKSILSDDDDDDSDAVDRMKSWIERFGDLKAFKLKFGHCSPLLSANASEEEKLLWAWLNNQRSYYRRGVYLSKGKIDLLRGLGCDGFRSKGSRDNVASAGTLAASLSDAPATSTTKDKKQSPDESSTNICATREYYEKEKVQQVPLKEPINLAPLKASAEAKKARKRDLHKISKGKDRVLKKRQYDETRYANMPQEEKKQRTITGFEETSLVEKAAQPPTPNSLNGRNSSSLTAAQGSTSTGKEPTMALNRVSLSPLSIRPPGFANPPSSARDMVDLSTTEEANSNQPEVIGKQQYQVNSNAPGDGNYYPGQHAINEAQRGIEGEEEGNETSLTKTHSIITSTENAGQNKKRATLEDVRQHTKKDTSEDVRQNTKKDLQEGNEDNVELDKAHRAVKRTRAGRYSKAKRRFPIEEYVSY